MKNKKIFKDKIIKWVQKNELNPNEENKAENTPKKIRAYLN